MLKGRGIMRGGAVCLAGLMTVLLAGCPPGTSGNDAALEDIAQAWMTLAVDACAVDRGMPTVEARTLWQVSATMFEAWAAYDDTASGYFTGKRLKQPVETHSLQNQAEALSHAVYALLRERFVGLAAQAPGTPARDAYDAFTTLMQERGYLDSAGAPFTSDAQALGEEIGGIVLAFCERDGANEANGYADTSGFVPFNPPLDVEYSGTDVNDINRWQPLQLPSGAIQSYLTPHWGGVKSLSLPQYDRFNLRVDPGAPPLFGTNTGAQFIQTFQELLAFSNALDPADGAGADTINISPGVKGNNTFNFDGGTGHPVNPYTGEPYADILVKRGDYYRTMAVRLDGPHYGTPAPWWMEVLTDILAGEGYVDRRPANKFRAHDLEYDLKIYFAASAAIHDAAIAVWDVKRHYEWVRPITAIRWLGENGFLNLQPGVVEIIAEGDPLAGDAGENIGKQKIRAWQGPYQGVGWMLPGDWIPYQTPNFVTPPFPGYSSGHTGMGRAFATVMTQMTGDPYFPGGKMEWTATSLTFESGPTQPIKLQWATYLDAGDEAGRARMLSGVHPFADIYGSRILGSIVGDMVYDRAQEYFAGTGIANAK